MTDTDHDRQGDSDRTLIAALAPALRGALAVGGTPPTITSVPGSAGSAGSGRSLVIEDVSPDPQDCAGAVVRRVREYLEAQGVPERIIIPGRAEFIPEFAIAAGRMAGKVVVVTGAAQGFGFGIAQGMAQMGAHVVVADINGEAAGTAAARIQEGCPSSRIIAVTMNVADLESTRSAVAEVVATFGGLDLYVSNAGVVRAGGVMEQDLRDFDMVTQVNYRGYLIGVKSVAPVMAAQHAANPELWYDIVEVNSKSGLEGSKRNFAYSGSKFGGIGLTQSFALELVDSGIKVNAVCPGNFLDGPLWQDPENGLLIQYLRAGKVPGARTTDDVLKYYQAKVPIGRGCLPEDLLKAICYAVEQQYETGQAIPVTGGQTMLN